MQSRTQNAPQTAKKRSAASDQQNAEGAGKTSSKAERRRQRAREKREREIAAAKRADRHLLYPSSFQRPGRQALPTADAQIARECDRVADDFIRSGQGWQGRTRAENLKDAALARAAELERAREVRNAEARAAKANAKAAKAEREKLALARERALLEADRKRREERKERTRPDA